MSIFIRIERPGHTSRLVRVKEEEALFGEDDAGILTVSNVTNPIFSMRFGRIVPLSPLLKEEPATFPPIRFFSYLDFRLLVLACSKTSEFYASIFDLPLSALPQIVSQNPVLSVRYAGVHHRFPLPNGRKLLVGSDIGCHIIIGLSGIRSFHCALRHERGVLEVEPLQGVMGVDSETIINRRPFPKLPMTLLLKPLYLPLVITP